MSFLKPKPATSTSSSTSENVNNGLITSTYGGQMNAGTGATNFLSSLLGVSPQGVANTANTVGTAANGIAENGGAQAGYQNYLQNAGYAPAMRQLAQGVTGQGAAAGILNSGTTAKALQSRGADLNSQYFNNYLQQLSNLSSQGLQAGGLVANAGQKSTSTGTSTGASPSTLGSIASTVGGIASIFSDRRLKTAIRKVGEFADGLGIYTFRYHGHKQRVRGVMADEVERLRPWALGPIVIGFRTVNYGAL
jgi:phage-related protein